MKQGKSSDGSIPPLSPRNSRLEPGSWLAVLLRLGTALSVFLANWGSSAPAQTPTVGEARPKPVLVLQTGQVRFHSLTLSQDGRWLATASGSEIVVWDVLSGLEFRTLSGHKQEVLGLNFSPDSRFLASASADNNVKLWDLTSGLEIRTFVGHTSAVRSVAFSLDGRWLASGGQDKTIILWDVATGRKVRTLQGHSNWILSIAFSPNGKWLASGGADSLVKIWDAATGREISNLSGHSGAVASVAFSPDGQLLASGSSDKTIKLWEVSKGREVFTFSGHVSMVATVTFSPDGRWLASESLDQTIRLWDLTQRREFGNLPADPLRVASADQTKASDAKDSLKITGFATGEGIAFGPDAKRLIGGSGGHVKVWEVPSGKEVSSFSGRTASVAGFAFCPKANKVSAVAPTGIVANWDTTTGRGSVIQTGKGLWQPLEQDVAFAPEDQWFAAVPATRPSMIGLFDTATGQELKTFSGHLGPVSTVGVNSDGTLLASGSWDGTVRLWEVARGKEARVLARHSDASELVGEYSVRFYPIKAVVFSPDSNLVASTWRNTVELWEASTGRKRYTFLAGKPDVAAIAFSPDGRWLASGGFDGSLKLWEVTSGRELRAFTSSRNAVLAVAFSPAGHWLASATYDGSVKLWDVADGGEIQIVKGHALPVKGIAFSPDGHWLAFWSDDGSVRIWDCTLRKEAALLSIMRDSDDWVVTTPDGLFDGSEEGTRKLVAWRIGNHVYPPDRFFADFYTPGLLGRMFAGEELKATVDLSGLDLAPDVHINSPASGSMTKQEHAVVVVEAKDLGGGVGEMRLYQNGKLVGKRPGTRGMNSNYAFEVELIPGENILKATAVSKERVESNEDWVRVAYEAPRPVQPTLRLLVVGINKYEDSALDLGFARQDGQALADFFVHHGKRLFQSVDAIELFDGEATQANIRKALDRLVEQSKPEDVLVVYLAGHGVGLGQQFYFLPHEMHSEGDDEAAIRKFGLPATILGDYLRRIPALKQVLILDACEAGTALPVLAKLVTFRGFSPAEHKAAQMLARSNGVYLIAASQRQQEAVEVPALGHGVLAYALLSGLGEKGEPKASTTGGMVTVLSLLQYVNEEVPELTEKFHAGDKQYPVSFNTGMDFPLLVQ